MLRGRTDERRGAWAAEDERFRCEKCAERQGSATQRTKYFCVDFEWCVCVCVCRRRPGGGGGGGGDGGGGGAAAAAAAAR